MGIILNCEAINAVLPAVSKDRCAPGCFYGVHIEDKDDSRIYTACDSSILLMVKTPLNDDEERLDKDYVLKIDKPFGKKNFMADFLVVDEKTAILKGFETKTAEILYCTYPDVSRVIPADDTPIAKEYAAFNPDYMKKVNTFLGTTCQMPQMQDAKSPALWRKENRTAVLTPLRFE